MYIQNDRILLSHKRNNLLINKMYDSQMNLLQLKEARFKSCAMYDSILYVSGTQVSWKELSYQISE